jgi:hypothetical protein
MKWGIIYMVIGGIGVLLALWRITHMDRKALKRMFSDDPIASERMMDYPKWAAEQERRKRALEKGGLNG